MVFEYVYMVTDRLRLYRHVTGVGAPKNERIRINERKISTAYLFFVGGEKRCIQGCGVET